MNINIEQYAPLVFFVYNRANKALDILNSLLEVDLIEKTDLYIYSDGPQNSNDSTLVKEVRTTIEHSEAIKKCHTFTLIKREKNVGLANSIISGVTEVINRYGKVIVVEDDNILSKDFLRYMNICLEYYRNVKIVGSIAGLSSLKLDDFPKDYNYDIYLLERTCSFAWATWKNVWDEVDWDVKDYKDFKKNKSVRKKFDETGNNHSYLLDAHIFGRVNSWAIRFDYSLFRRNLLTLYPKYSKVKNVGYDGSGTHYNRKQRMRPWERNISEIIFSNDEKNEIWEINNLTLDNRIQHIYCEYNNIGCLTLELKYLKMYLCYLKARLFKMKKVNKWKEED